MDFGYIVCAGVGLIAAGVPIWHLQQYNSVVNRVRQTAVCPSCGKGDIQINSVKLVDRETQLEINFLRKVFLSVLALLFSIGILASAVNAAIDILFRQGQNTAEFEGPVAFTVAVCLFTVVIAFFSIKSLREFFRADRGFEVAISCMYCGYQTNFPM